MSRKWAEYRHIVHAYTVQEEKGIGPFATFVWYLRNMGIKIESDYAVLSIGERVRIPYQENDGSRWGHAWRNLLRTAELAQRGHHRREYWEVPLMAAGLGPYYEIVADLDTLDTYDRSGDGPHRWLLVT